MNKSSTWTALRNLAFRKLWIATVISGTCVAAHDSAATWMGFFEIQWRASTKKDLRAMPPHEVERIVAAVEKLSDEPFPYGFQKLTGAAHTYRIRIGDYRVVYEGAGRVKDR
jgi:mRNA interferase RelE/StbE